MWGVSCGDAVVRRREIDAKTSDEPRIGSLNRRRPWAVLIPGVAGIPADKYLAHVGYPAELRPLLRTIARCATWASAWQKRAALSSRALPLLHSSLRALATTSDTSPEEAKVSTGCAAGPLLESRYIVASSRSPALAPSQHPCGQICEHLPPSPDLRVSCAASSLELDRANGKIERPCQC